MVTEEKIPVKEYNHIDPKKGKIVVSDLSPIVIMKKISFKRPEEIDSTKHLPELYDCDESQVLREQSQCGSSTNPTVVANSDIAFVDSLAPEDLKNHIQKCLEMSAENKITLKNAFALQLIDCMKFMMQKKDFSAMACTLDAGAKIYSYRVDSLHQQVRKLAEEIIANHREEKKGNSTEGEDAEEGDAKKKRRANKKFIIASAESLRRKPVGKDPKDNYAKIDSRVGAFLSSARTDPKDLSLTIEKRIPFWPNWETYRPLKAGGSVVLPQIKIFRDNKNKMEISDEFTRECVEEHDVETEELKECAVELSSNDDNNQSVSDKGSHSAEGSVISMGSVAGENENNVIDTNENVQEANVISTALKKMQEEAKEFGGGEPPSRLKAMQILFADINDDYNYFNVKSVNYWAGPDFWKRPNKIKRNDTATKKNVTGRKKGYKEIVYDFEGLEEKWEKLFNKTRSLGNKALENWKHHKTTLPSDVKADNKTFIDLFHISLSRGQINSENEPDTTVEAALKHDISSFNTGYEETNDVVDTSDSQQDTLNDCFYKNAPENSGSSAEDRDQLNACFYDAGLVPHPRPQPSSTSREPGHVFKVEINSDNTATYDNFLVPAPKVVSFEPIRFTARPIRVDMQHLKETMKEIIHQEFENYVEFDKSQPDTTLMESGNSRPKAKFSKIMESLPKKLDRLTLQDLSPGMAFLALLTLANENNFHLEKVDELNDVVVTFKDN